MELEFPVKMHIYTLFSYSLQSFRKFCAVGLKGVALQKKKPGLND